MKWSLESNGKKQSLAQWGLSNLHLSKYNQAKDILTFSHPNAAYDQPPLFPPESIITIYKNNTPWFHGIITKIPTFASHSSEAHQYSASGPWWFLENLIFQQSWNQLSPHNSNSPQPQTTTISSSHLILGQNNKGNPIHNGSQIKEVLQYTLKHHPHFQIGSISPNTHFPLDETKDLSCADTIKRLLRWSPDASSFFDYSTSPPTLHIQNRKKLTPITIDTSQNTANLSISPRHDLLSPSVIIKYEKSHSHKNQHFTTTHIDAYPKNTTGTELKSLVLTIQLHGSHSQTISQHLKSQEINIHSPSWWKHHLPALTNIPTSKISIKSPSRSSSLPFELTEGSIAPWMNQDAEEDTIHALISYKTKSDHIIDQHVAVKLIATNAQSRTYSHILSSSPEEPTPKSLAKKLYQSLSTLHYDGHITLIHQELPHPNLIAHSLNLSNANPNWASMNASIQSTHENIDSGTTTIHFGPPKHLGADDLVQLLRLNHHRSPSTNSLRRTTGTNHNTSIQQPSHSPIQNAHTSSRKFAKLIFHNPNNPKSKITIDANSINKNLNVQLQEEFICENGELKKRLVLASQPYQS